MAYFSVERKSMLFLMNLMRLKSLNSVSIALTLSASEVIFTSYFSVSERSLSISLSWMAELVSRSLLSTLLVTLALSSSYTKSMMSVFSKFV